MLGRRDYSWQGPQEPQEEGVEWETSQGRDPNQWYKDSSHGDSMQREGHREAHRGRGWWGQHGPPGSGTEML